MTPKEMKGKAFSNVYAALLAEFRGTDHSNNAGVMAAAYQSLDLMTTEDFKWLMQKAQGYVNYEKEETRKAHELTKKEAAAIVQWFSEQIQGFQLEQVEARGAYQYDMEARQSGREFAFVTTKHLIRAGRTIGDLQRLYGKFEGRTLVTLNDEKYHNLNWGKLEGYRMIRHYFEAFKVKG